MSLSTEAGIHVSFKLLGKLIVFFVILLVASFFLGYGSGSKPNRGEIAKQPQPSPTVARDDPNYIP
jgi:hypothetical protein